VYFSSSRTSNLVGALPIVVGKGQEPTDISETNRLRLVKRLLLNAKFHAIMHNNVSSPPSSKSSYEESIELLNEVWRTFYPWSTDRFSVESVSDDPETGFDVFLMGRDSERVPIDGLSSGQLELFTLFGSLLRLKTLEGILFIDEPELHLDPQWHALMLHALRRFLPKVQLIVATHSPRVYDSVLSFQRFFLVPDDDPRARAWKSPVEVA
jgi:hypothetical protein